MAGLTFRLLGGKEMRKNLRGANGRLKKALGAGLYLTGNNVMTKTKGRVPVDFGILKNSGYVTLPEVVGNKVKVEMGFGGPAQDYAIVQELHTEYQHPEGGQALFMTSSVNEAEATFLRDVAAFARAAFERNYGPTKMGPTSPWEGD